MNRQAACQLFTVVLLLMTMSAASATVYAQGIALSGVGPVNRAMGGAATAAPIDASGALHWNPASISGLQSSEMQFGLELLLPTEEISSRIDANALGPGTPAVSLAGSTRAEPGVAPIPVVGLVYKPEDSQWTYGLGVYGIAGFKLNYPASTTNPILTPPPPNGLGFGRIFAEADFLQVAPTVSYAVTDKLSIGLAPTLTLARIAVTPLALAPPDNANMDPFFTYRNGLGTRYHFGGGFQVGAYYITDNYWHLGASVKSPQWFEKFRFNTEDELGLPRVDEVEVEYPMIVSLGAAYSGFENWLFAVDVRYFDYKHAEGFGTSGFDANGAVRGLGWSSIFSTHTGIQYRATDCLFLRGGYYFTQNPIHSSDDFVNAATPLIIQHAVSLGVSYELAPNTILSLAYLHAFENEVRGPFVLPGVGPVPGTSVASQVSADALIMGFTVRY
jgi:long-chain fatty acid transport protein